jgi:glycosyltransferase involved in cell wall biosynthesis
LSNPQLFESGWKIFLFPDMSLGVELKQSSKAKLTCAVVVCMYAGENYLRQQLLSLAAQTRKPEFVVIYSDASPDASMSVALEHKYLFNNSALSYISGRNRMGSAKSFLFASSTSKGDVIFFCDQDDFWLPSKISEVMSIMENCPEIACVTHDLIVSDEELRSRFRYSRRWSLSRLSLSRDRLFLHGCAIAVRREILDFIRFPEAIPIGHDKATFFAAKAFGQVFYLDLPLVIYRRHSSNISNDELIYGGRKRLQTDLFTRKTASVELSRLSKERAFLTKLIEHYSHDSAQTTYFEIGKENFRERSFLVSSWLPQRLAYLKNRIALREAYINDTIAPPRLDKLIISIIRDEFRVARIVRETILYTVVVTVRLKNAIKHFC